jgi:hypothetical protein
MFPTNSPMLGVLYAIEEVEGRRRVLRKASSPSVETAEKQPRRKMREICDDRIFLQVEFSKIPLKPPDYAGRHRKRGNTRDNAQNT